MQQSHENHYVPKWHQKGFILPGEQSYHCRNLDPLIKELPSHEKIKIGEYTTSVPTQCFKKRDLYTTHIFSQLDDSIEKFLFGEIDNRGALAVRAMAQNDYPTLHHHFKQLFEYLDAQKLRTPKGLQWIKNHFPNLNQNKLMSEMLSLRNSHCVMWSEAIREVVSAENSSVKFILSDHPVTIFNIACPPNHPFNTNPDEPSIAFKGSQTVFPLDMNKCLILTNLEYGKDPTGVDPLIPRTNARFSGETIFMTNNTIQVRKLKTEQVMAINYFFKTQASKFLAAADKDWLNPEIFTWKEIAKVLIPPENEIWNYGGQTTVGFEDGSFISRDAFGRKIDVPADIVEMIKKIKEKDLKTNKSKEG